MNTVFGGYCFVSNGLQLMHHITTRRFQTFRPTPFGHVVGGILVIMLLLMTKPSVGQDAPAVLEKVPFEQVYGNWKDCGLRDLEKNAFVAHYGNLAKRGEETAQIQVDYGDGFTAEARGAFERAVEIWETHISSPVPIRVEAKFEPLEEDRALGGARSNILFALDTNGDEQIDTIYGDALVDAVLGDDQNPTDPDNPSPPDIIASFNSTRSDWYFGAGDAPEGKIDFTTVVLHEIAHGLNYFDVFSYDEGVGEYGFDWDNSGSVEDDERFAGVFGNRIFQETADGSTHFLTDRSIFPTPSDELGSALTSDQLFFDGLATERAAVGSDGPVPPKIYAPSEYDDGSSTSHLDEKTYGFETPNALMTPKINHAETVRRTGPIVCGQMGDMGWTLGPGCAFEDATIDIRSAESTTGPSNQGRVELTWSFTGDVSVDEFIVGQSFFDRSERRKRVPGTGAGEYSATVDGLRVGDHTFRILYVNSNGTTVQPGDPITVTVKAQSPDVSVYPNPFSDVAKVSFVLPDRQHVRVEVFDALGRHVATPFAGERPADDSRPVVFNSGSVPNLGSGQYFFRVSGEGFTETVKAMHIR